MERAGWHRWLRAGGVDSEVVGPVPVPEDVGIHLGLVESGAVVVSLESTLSGPETV